jgi:regulator of sirC expression with transglutaminase-like and TPR domain
LQSKPHNLVKKIKKSIKQNIIMKKKLFIIAAILFSSVAFTACEEEIIQPQSDTTGTGTGGDGAEKSDPEQWD